MGSCDGSAGYPGKNWFRGARRVGESLGCAVIGDETNRDNSER